MKIITGKVIKKSGEKTAKILVERVVLHPKYQKRYKTHKKYQVHDPYGVNPGETVSFVACRPVSKTKKWIVVKSGKEKK